MRKVETKYVEAFETVGIFGTDHVKGGWAVFEDGERISSIHDDKTYVEWLAKEVIEKYNKDFFELFGVE